MEQMGNDDEAASGVINKLIFFINNTHTCRVSEQKDCIIIITQSKSRDKFSACHLTPLKCNEKLLNSGCLIIKQRNHPSRMAKGLLDGFKTGIWNVEFMK